MTGAISEETSPISKPVEQQDGKMGAYKVQSGDTLSELAQKLLGSARETDRLYELNPEMFFETRTTFEWAVASLPTLQLRS